MRKIVIAGNWKMHKTQAESLAFVQDLMPELDSQAEERDIVLCAPYTALGPLSQKLQDSRVRLSAQNVHWADSGAFTGEVSGAMLAEMGVTHAVVGHSERREHFGDTDETVSWRAQAAQRHGLIPIVCIGESKQQRDAGETEAVITRQVRDSLAGLDLNRAIVAYEPIWAIGTGETCDATEANRAIGQIRSQLSNPEVTIQYGGSVKPDNIDAIMAQPQIDGVLVGGASLDPSKFARIVNYRSS